MKLNRILSLVAVSLALALVLLGAPHPARDNKHTKPEFPFEPSEELIYEGEVSRLFLRGINVADLKFTASRIPQNSGSEANTNQDLDQLRFTLDAITKGIFRKLFGLRFHQNVESLVDPRSFSVLKTVKLDEQGDRKRTSIALFDLTERKVTWTERDPTNPEREPRIVTNQIGDGSVQDIASSFYYLRTQELVVGNSFEMLVSDSGQVYRIPVRVVEKKKMKSIFGQVMTVRVDPEVFGGIIQGKGKMSVWLTDDARRIPIRARLSSEMGTLVIKLKRIITGQTKCS